MKQHKETSNPMLELTNHIRQLTFGLCRPGPGPYGFGVWNANISRIGIVIRMAPNPFQEQALPTETDFMVTVEAVSQEGRSYGKVIRDAELVKMSEEGDPATRIVAKAALLLCQPIQITMQECTDAFNVLAESEIQGSDIGITKEEARRLEQTGWYQGRTAEDIVSFQLFENRLCMPFEQFHSAVNAVLGHPVWTHEFANIDRLQEEFRARRQSLKQQTEGIATLTM